jgi:hypothetical protein
MPIYVQFENKARETISPEFGAYDFVQLTYDSLRTSIGDDEKALAFITSRGFWKVLHLEDGREDNLWTDVMIYQKER